MKIPSTKGLGNLQQLDRAAREQLHERKDQIGIFAEALIKSQSILNPNFSNACKNKDINRRSIDFMI
jgi:hypothetical protein